MRAMLSQSERLASIGLLSAGVAHEINNPLAYVGNNLAVLERDLGGILAMMDCYETAHDRLAAVAPEVLEQIRALSEELDWAYVRESTGRMLARTRDGVQRVATIVQNLRGLARTAPPTMEEAPVAELVDSALEMLQSPLRRGQIEVQVDLGPAPPTIRCVAQQISQVLLNLLINAIQAIESAPRPRGAGSGSRPAGRGSSRPWRSPTTARGSRRRPCPTCSTRSSPPSRWARGPAWACPSATASSPGTAAGSRSTAPPGRGPASACCCPRPRDRRGGPRPGPPRRRARPPPGTTPRNSRRPMPPPAKHCLLVVDDEPDVCDSVHDLLRREFRVLKANSGQEAFRLMQEEEVHLIMTDQRMPQITGVEVLTKVKVKNPHAIRMLFTGYADLEAVIAAINQGHVYQFLKKPWQPEDLQAAVRLAAAEYDRLISS
jgi:CheY-like chemotaxis protein